MSKLLARALSFALAVTVLVVVLAPLAMILPSEVVLVLALLAAPLVLGRLGRRLA